jgi:hypothetical protein
MKKERCHCELVPLDTRQDSSHIVCGAPPVLENIEAKLAGSIDIGVEHLTDEFDTRWFVGILFLKVHHQAKCAILERGIGGADDDGIPVELLANGTDHSNSYEAALHIPGHDIVGNGGCGNASGRVGLHAL